jgi:hypothetical protein
MIPRAPPVAAPLIKPSMVALVMDGVLVANIKPATAIHKVQRTMRMFMVHSQMAAAQPVSPLAAGVLQRRVTFQSGKRPITAALGPKALFAMKAQLIATALVLPDESLSWIDCHVPVKPPSGIHPLSTEGWRP